MKRFCEIVLALAFVLPLAGFALAQQQQQQQQQGGEREKGIELFKQGKNAEAIKALERASKENKTDAAIWNYLGLAYLKADDLKRAVKALEKAVDAESGNAVYKTNLAYAYLLGGKTGKALDASGAALALNAKSADAFYIRGAAYLDKGDYAKAVADADGAVAANADYALAYTLKSDALLANFVGSLGVGVKPREFLDLLAQSGAVLRDCLKSCRNNSYVSVQRERLDAVEAFYAYFEKRKDADLGELLVNASGESAAAAPPPPPAPDPNKVPIHIISTPRPEYTDAARRSNVSGRIRMLVLCTATGRVTHTRILRGLGYGLNENAVKAARAIQFSPALENGKPISSVVVIEYGFTLY